MQNDLHLSMKSLSMKPSTGNDYHAVKASEFSFCKERYEIFNVKFQKVPPVPESKQYKILKAFQPTYIYYLAKVAVQPRTRTEMIQNVLIIYFYLLMSKMDEFEIF